MTTGSLQLPTLTPSITSLTLDTPSNWGFLWNTQTSYPVARGRVFPPTAAAKNLLSPVADTTDAGHPHTQSDQLLSNPCRTHGIASEITKIVKKGSSKTGQPAVICRLRQMYWLALFYRQPALSHSFLPLFSPDHLPLLVPPSVCMVPPTHPSSDTLDTQVCNLWDVFLQTLAYQLVCLRMFVLLCLPYFHLSSFCLCIFFLWLPPFCVTLFCVEKILD